MPTRWGLPPKYIYIYIYNLDWWAQNRGGFCCVWGFSFSISLSFSPCFSLFPAVSWHLGTPKQPTKWGYRHIYIYIHIFFSLDKRPPTHSQVKRGQTWTFQMSILFSDLHLTLIETRKRGHYERGLFAGGISGISKIRYRPKGVLPQRCSAYFWRISDAFWNIPLFPIKQDVFLTHFWRMPTPLPKTSFGRYRKISTISKKMSRILLSFPESGGSLESLESLKSPESLEYGPRTHTWEVTRGPKKHINFFSINFLAPTQNTPFCRHQIWPGEGSTVQCKLSPPTPGSLKALLLPPLLNNVQTRERKGYRRGAARNFLHLFPLSSTPVVQSMIHIGHGFWAPRKKFVRLISWGRTQKRDPHELFRGDFWGQPGHFRPQKSSVYCFFPALSHIRWKFLGVSRWSLFCEMNRAHFRWF